MAKLYWRIQGYTAAERIFETRVKNGQFTVDQIRRLLQALAAKAGLSNDEIVGAYATRKTKIANDLLAVHADGKHPTWTCGSNPFFTASIVDEQGKIVKNPII